MELNIENAPTSPLTTRSSYLYNGMVVNHNIQITFSDHSFPRPFTEEESGSTHNVHVQKVDPKKIEEETIKAIKMLIEEDAIATNRPKFALVWQQVVGKDNTTFEDTPKVFKVDWD